MAGSLPKPGQSFDRNVLGVTLSHEFTRIRTNAGQTRPHANLHSQRLTRSGGRDDSPVVHGLNLTVLPGIMSAHGPRGRGPSRDTNTWCARRSRRSLDRRPACCFGHSVTSNRRNARSTILPALEVQPRLEVGVKVQVFLPLSFQADSAANISRDIEVFAVIERGFAFFEPTPRNAFQWQTFLFR